MYRMDVKAIKKFSKIRVETKEIVSYLACYLIMQGGIV